MVQTICKGFQDRSASLSTGEGPRERPFNAKTNAIYSELFKCCLKHFFGSLLNLEYAKSRKGKTATISASPI